MFLILIIVGAHGVSDVQFVGVKVAAAAIPAGPGGGDGSLTFTDSNGDGIPDDMQAAADSNKLGSPAATAALSKVKLAAQLNFAHAGKDALRLDGGLTPPAGSNRWARC